LVVDGIESAGWVFRAPSEIRNVMRQTKSSQRKVRRASATGTTGLKSTAIATNPVAQRYLPARTAYVAARRPDIQTTTSNITW
jgi:hypothetical protein